MQEENYIKIIDAPKGTSTGFLYLGHSGDHYILLNKVYMKEKELRVYEIVVLQQCSSVVLIFQELQMQPKLAEKLNL